MRLIDSDRLPVSKVGRIPVVLLEDINNAKTIVPKLKEVAPAETIDVRWLQKRMIQGISEDERHLESVSFEIINGYRPEDQYCGYTDIPGHEKIPRFEFVLKDLGATITLCVYEGADENGQNNATYRVAFTIGAWNDGFTRQAIGNAYIDGKVEQAYVSGGTIYFGRDWFL